MQREVVAASMQGFAGSILGPVSAIVLWTKPQQGWRKLNSDGAVDRGPWLIRISHVGRGGNFAADWMAKQANFDDLLCHRYLSPPDGISLLLQQDVVD
ncbi:hypothetical protein V6N11_056861 [Hibiscus sabdariffa]|uniref:RNase H type-1 domain-containing protein n=1 Tax=Hibiscus sabdariffa TaxID=183260 RepID=A0ABR2T5R0_9ROSI